MDHCVSWSTPYRLLLLSFAFFSLCYVGFFPLHSRGKLCDSLLIKLNIEFCIPTFMFTKKKAVQRYIYLVSVKIQSTKLARWIWYKFPLVLLPPLIFFCLYSVLLLMLFSGCYLSLFMVVESLSVDTLIPIDIQILNKLHLNE